MKSYISFQLFSWVRYFCSRWDLSFWGVTLIQLDETLPNSIDWPVRLYSTLNLSTYFFVLLLLCVNLVKMQKLMESSPVYIPSNVLVQLPIVFQQELDYCQQVIKVTFVIQPSSSRLWGSWSSFAIRSLLIIWVFQYQLI
jgi:hypothetical protein